MITQQKRAERGEFSATDHLIGGLEEGAQRRNVADMDEVAFDQRDIDRADARGFLGRAGDAQFGKARLEAGQALNMIGVVMRALLPR